MKKADIKQIISDNEDNKLSILFSTLIDKSKNLDNKIQKTSLGTLIIILLYYLAELQLMNTIQIGPLNIGNSKSIEIVFPLILSFLILRYQVLSSHKAEIKTIIEQFSTRFFNYSYFEERILKTDDLTRILMPHSIHEEINKLSHKTKAGCLGTILMMPLLLLAAAPYTIAILWLYPFFENFSTQTFLNKILIIGTCWVLIMCAYYFIKTMKIGIKENE